MFSHCIFARYNILAKFLMSRLKYLVIISVFIAAVALVGIWYLATRKFTDTVSEQSIYSIRALELINEFQKSDSVANIKFAGKIISVNGTVTSVEPTDSTVNIKLVDTASGSYAIFNFQQKNLAETKTIKQGDKVTIKGYCSGGVYSKILEAEFISFTRCVLNK